MFDVSEYVHVVADSLNMANTSYNLTVKLGSLFSFPSRFIARIRKIDDMINQDFENASLTAAAMSNNRIHRMSPEGNIPYELVAMPGPWAFLTSGYAVGLLAMALLLNRIQHIVVPPRQTFTERLTRSRRSILQALLYSTFPINLNSTTYRLAFRIPSLYLLFRSLLLLTIILLQGSNLWPSSNYRWLNVIGEWAGQKEFGEVCWSTFGAICAALGVGALTRGLEGISSSNAAPFNLFGYAFLLHIYSVPITHVVRGPPSRPDKHVIVTIILPLLQLTMTHFLGIKKTWARQRLIPTGICSILTLLHFHAVLLTSPSSYPLLNYLPCLLESLLVLVTALACTLNVLTQLLLEGTISRPLFGHTRTLVPKADEDFAVVLLRLGTASLEATSVVGLGYEVGSVSVRHTMQLGTVHSPEAPSDQPSIELNRVGVVGVSHGLHRKQGFTNEIKSVKVTGMEADWWYSSAWLRELTRFGMGIVAAARGIWRLILRRTWYKWRGVDQPFDSANKHTTAVGARRGTMHFVAREDEEEYIYRRFLRGEPLSDDDDDEYDPARSSRSRSQSGSPERSTPASDAENENDLSSDENDPGETANLYSDLLSSPSTASAPMLLAHMSTPTSSRLTRRRYSQLVSSQQRVESSGRNFIGELEVDEWANFVQDRRDAALRHDAHDNGDEIRRNCVICTVEQREVICWPCRCLALCDDCRANLASRFAASKHTCPCCRRNVEGYSRIFIP
ncbi:hypothetical protein BD410DRAFT_766450 [Rickenella mellea]|uniref:RING-type domain-containing protein n=1 Tax=Rickenella mellea TaxID=50990 RepID=A0A4Y7QC82_9AGAM|nr:hypothetical protein BD410DRAFT_766450 [Rickenella mellea]